MRLQTRVLSLLILMILVAVPLKAHAFYLSEQTLYSALQLTQNLYADGDIGLAKDEIPPFSWNLFYGYEKTSTPNDGSAPIVDDTYSYSAGFGWVGDSGYSANVKLNYSDTPAEQLFVRGGQLSLAYHWEYAKVEPTAIFAPYINFKMLFASSNFVETFTGQITRKKQAPKLVSGLSEIDQTMAGVDLTWRPRRAWRFDFEFDQFFFNRDVSAFESRLDSPASLQEGMNGFTDTVGGLAIVTYNVGVAWDFTQNWRLEFTEQYSLLALDYSSSTMEKLTVSDQFAKAWKLTVGVEQQDSNVLSDTLAVLGVECEI